MTMIEELSLEHCPVDRPVYVALFKDVRNAAVLRQHLLSGNEAFEYAFIDASVIVSRLHILSAVFRAIYESLHNRLQSRNVHSEVVFSLSPNNNISESFRRFGIGDLTTSLIAIKVSTSPSITLESVQQHLTEVIEGTSIEFTDKNLGAQVDMIRVRKAYKLDSRENKTGVKSQAGRSNAHGVDGVTAAGKTELEAALLSAMALRGVS